MRYRTVVGCVVAVGAMVCVQSATTLAWSKEGTTITAQPYDASAYINEIDQPMTTIRLMGQDEQIRSVPARVYEGKSVKIAQIPVIGGWAILTGTDSIYRQLQGVMNGGGVMVVNGTNTLVFPVTGTAMDGFNIRIAKDIAQVLSPNYGPHRVIVSYGIKPERTEYWLQYTDSAGMMRYPYVYNIVYSANQRFAVFWLNWEQFVRVDFSTGESKVFFAARGAWYDGIYARRASAITNDGRYIFIDDGTLAVEIQPTCGFTIDPRVFNGRIDGNYVQCPIHEYQVQPVAGYQGRHQYFRLAADEQSATYLMTSYPYTSDPRVPAKVTLTTKASGAKKVSYLALGDSYSSGEGDTEINPATKKKYYLAGTDREASTLFPREKCHISSRSYPFWLGSFMQVRDDTYSVACSGAMIDDMNGNSEYWGQQLENGSGRLTGIASAVQLRVEAMNDFIPGRVRQVELVKKYKPETITVTAGGNDAQFAKVIRTCVNIDPTRDWTPTCYFADSAAGRESLRNFVANQYEPLKKLYTALHDASPTTKIYVLGYPQFINADAADNQCKPNVRLNKAERIMIRESVDYMNTVIKNAASSAGVKYVDVSSALVGHRLCDSSDTEGQIYVTGIALKGLSEAQESYHPNDGGHIMLANAVKRATNNQSLRTFSYCVNGATICPDSSVEAPATPQYFEASTKKNTQTVPIIPTTGKRGTDLVAVAAPGTLQASSAVRVTLYSREYRLPDIVATNEGGVQEAIRIPADIEPGFHTMVFSGTSPSGEPVDIINFVELYASENDKDGDGVLDTADQCLYAAPIGVDEDKDGIDDGCDPYIGKAPETPPESIVSGERPAPVSATTPSLANKQSLVFPDVRRASSVPLSFTQQLIGDGVTSGNQAPGMQKQIQKHVPQLESDSLTRLNQKEGDDMMVILFLTSLGIVGALGFLVGRLVSKKRV